MNDSANPIVGEITPQETEGLSTEPVVFDTDVDGTSITVEMDSEFDAYEYERDLSAIEAAHPECFTPKEKR